jgi:integrase
VIDKQVVILPPFSVHARPRGSCQIRFRLDGVPQSVSTGTKNKRQAESQAQAILTRWLIAHGKTTAKGKTSLEAAVAGFLDTQYANLKPSTRDEAELILRRFQECFPVPNVQDITPEVFKARAGKLKGAAAPKYWANILSTCRRFSRSLVAEGKIVQDFTAGIPMPPKGSFKIREETWTDSELEATLAAVAPFDAEVLTVMRWTGMDTADVAELRRKHLVKDEAGAWVIRKRREKGKSDAETILQPLGSKVLPILMDRYNTTRYPEDKLFGDAFASIRSFNTSLMGRVRRATAPLGLPLKNLKALRHTFATYHAERGVPLDVLRKWMGHAKDSRTLDRVYVHRASTARFMD